MRFELDVSGTINVIVQGLQGGSDERLKAIENQLVTLVTQGERQMKANAEVLAFLDSLNTYTNEIAADIDQLIADGQLDDATRARMKAHSETLKGIAAKNDDPLPPPVEPTPVVE